MYYRLLVLIFLISCGKDVVTTSGDEDSSGKLKARSPITLVGDIMVRQGESISYNSLTHFSIDVSTGHTFSKVIGDVFLNVNPTTGEVTGETDDISNFEGTLQIKAVNNGDASEVLSSEILVAVNGDPLRVYAWHLNNTGQKNFAVFGGTVGVDINVDDVFKDGITGNGVKVAVSDSGVELEHDDLNLNAISGAHRDYSLSPPYTSSPTPSNYHGTAVTGIINAVGWNNYGSIGIAPDAKFAGFQFLRSAQTSSIIIDQASGDFDIFNYSYGDFIFEDTTSDSTYNDHLRSQTITSNKVFVKAAGNEFISLASGGRCASHNANFPLDNESPFMLVIGAIDAAGAKASYSNAGSNIWVVAPGGEDGESRGPAIMTTDLPTCFRGTSKATSNPDNSFEFNNSLNLRCDYTSTMNGTSAATPMVSGVIALMREANPALKMRDIKHIFATTSVQVDPTHSTAFNGFGGTHPSDFSASCSVNYNLAGHTYEQGWVTNNAGYKFNNFYGFGLIDAKAAVDAAKVYVSTIGTQVELNPNFNIADFYSTPALAIPDNSSVGATDVINVVENHTVESVQVRVNITHAKSGEIGVELTSPDGTKSILMNINNSFIFEDDSDLNIILTSNAFYGESSAGNWTLKLVDGFAGSAGTLNRWDINILGH